jgi:hypothetical protein
MADGSTQSERYLTVLCRDSFLRMWSWPNIHRDQKWGGGEEGKEICDLLVVFGNQIIVFSDKFCQFPSTGDPERDWCRWFKRAVWKSAEQIWGAERWLMENPDRVFVDKACKQKLPIPLPPRDSSVFNRIIVAHGSGNRCRAALGGSGSLMVLPGLLGKQHYDPSTGAIHPFTIGRLSDSRGFIHVIDDFTLDVLLRTLDTTADFLRYLGRKEALLQSGGLKMAAGEEELLAYYLRNTDAAGQHDFVAPVDCDSILIDEGIWDDFQTHPDRLAQVTENRISYAWDDLMEHFTGHVLGGTSAFQTSPSLVEAAVPLRLMAQADRTERRVLAKAFLGNMERGTEEDRAARIVLPAGRPGPYYVFLTLKPRTDKSYDEYALVRRTLLEAYCRVVRHRFSGAMDIVGIAAEPAGNEDGSEDLLYFNGRNWTADLDPEARSLSKELKILTEPRPYHIRESEFPRADLHERLKGRNRNVPCSCGSGKKFKKCCATRRA